MERYAFVRAWCGLPRSETDALCSQSASPTVRAVVLHAGVWPFSRHFFGVSLKALSSRYVVVRFYVNTTTEFPVSYVEGLLDVTNLGTIYRTGSSSYGTLAELGTCNSFVVSDNAYLPGVLSQAAFSPAGGPTRLNFTTYGITNFTAPAIVAQVVIATPAQAIVGTLTATLPTYIHYTSVISAGLTDDPTCPLPWYVRVRVCVRVC